MQPPFVPIGYAVSRTARAHLWKRWGAAAEPCELIVDEVVARVESHLAFHILCPLHVVVFASNAEARAALGRPVPPNMLLAPLQGASQSVIAMQSVAADALNGDLARMRRLLAHELTHVAVALQTGSEKCLGDDDRSMRVQPWVNEGFACVVSALAAERLDLLERELARASSLHVPDLDAALNDLAAENRSLAFAIATARVWRAVQAHGLCRVFTTLSDPDAWSSRGELPSG